MATMPDPTTRASAAPPSPRIHARRPASLDRSAAAASHGAVDHGQLRHPGHEVGGRPGDRTASLCPGALEAVSPGGGAQGDDQAGHDGCEQHEARHWQDDADPDRTHQAGCAGCQDWECETDVEVLECVDVLDRAVEQVS